MPHRYIALNPVRATMIDDPSEYRWSSYHHNALGQPDKLIESHADYLRLGTDPAERQAAYRELFRAHIDAEMLKSIRQATQTNRVFGSELFQKKVEAALALHIQKRRSFYSDFLRAADSRLGARPTPRAHRTR